MPTITPSLATGQAIYEAGISGFSGFRSKDDAADTKDIYGAYSHRAVNMSATEATEWISLWEWMIQTGLAGGGSLAIINSTASTIPAGPVAITGYDAVNQKFKIGLAGNLSGVRASFVLLTALVSGGQGVAYIGGRFRSTVNTSASSLGAPVYADQYSGMTLTEPSGISGFSGYSSCSYAQQVGSVASLEVSGMVQGWVQQEAKVNGQMIQTGAIGNRHYKPDENINTPVKAGAPTGGRDGDVVIDSSDNRIYCRYGGAWHYASLT